MSRLGAAFLTTMLLAAAAPLFPAQAAEGVPHRIAHDAAWGCRDKGDVLELLFLGISTSFDSKLAGAFAEGRCVHFTAGESVVVVDPGANGLVRVQRPGAVPALYWTPSRNLK